MEINNINLSKAKIFLLNTSQISPLMFTYLQHCCCPLVHDLSEYCRFSSPLFLSHIPSIKDLILNWAFLSWMTYLCFLAHPHLPLFSSFLLHFRQISFSLWAFVPAFSSPPWNTLCCLSSSGRLLLALQTLSSMSPPQGVFPDLNSLLHALP